MHPKKGFTLIELLVVIAIIAILAAILFPVFANARDKARQISGLSNIKQIALGNIMYCNDYDETFPIGSDGNVFGPGNVVNWVYGIYPYVTDYHILFGPNDNKSNIPTYQSWGYYLGVTMSYGVNAAEAGNKRYGVFGSGLDFGGSYTNSIVCKQAEVTQPSSTVLLADLQSADVEKLSGTTPSGINGVTAGQYYSGFSGSVAATGNDTGYTDTGLIGLGNYWVTWSDISSAVADEAVQGTVSSATDNAALWQLPNPSRSATAPYPFGPNGIVSAPYSNKSITNFAFIDGHAKGMKAPSTNPDGVFLSSTSVPDANNMWIVAR
jgi:prepilin-type N-terminal cleavage/methylation domain-containing protein/prepilin-type processing-associated H-X9-DG protein